VPVTCAGLALLLIRRPGSVSAPLRRLSVDPL
jgi:hypothetical protein